MPTPETIIIDGKEYPLGFNGCIDPFPYFSEVIYPSIKKGMNGQFVLQIQTYLNKINKSNLIIDGKYGIKTELALKVFKQ